MIHLKWNRVQILAHFNQQIPVVMSKLGMLRKNGATRSITPGNGVGFYGPYALTSYSRYLRGKSMMKQWKRTDLYAWYTGLANQVRVPCSNDVICIRSIPCKTTALL